MPHKDQMVQIYVATDGEVDPNSFYDLPELAAPPPAGESAEGDAA